MVKWIVFFVLISPVPLLSQEAAPTENEAADADGLVSEDSGKDSFSRAWSVTLYGALMTKQTVGRAFVPPTPLERSDGFIALALGRKMVSLAARAQLELEGQFVKHTGNQRHVELNGLGIGRWVAFPWNRYLATTLALGGGVSYATEEPLFEVLTHGQTSQWLIYLLFEATISPPRHPQWGIVYRLHHRSGLLGTFSGIRGASNALGLGFKYQW